MTASQRLSESQRKTNKVNPLAAGSASAQQPSGTSQQPVPTPPYGPPITLEQAKRVMAAAELEAAKNSWQVAVTILDSGGNMVMFHKLDNTQLASIGVSEGKFAAQPSPSPGHLGPKRPA